jgi:nucleotide-binding universal stress UspA family protein
MKTIVVGVDGSENAWAALDFAIQEAELRGAELQLVSVWQIPPFATTGPFGPFAAPDPAASVETAQRDAELIAQEAAKRVARAAPDLSTSIVVAEGEPGRLLTELSEKAVLVTVGRRGQSRLDKLLGSVGAYVLDHSRCPAVVVPRPETTA